MITACRTDIFAGDRSMTEHACAERCERFYSQRERDAYADAATRARCLDKLFAQFDAADHRDVRWSMIGDLVRHIAGAKS